ncbi:transposable element Tcb1 transposase [Trichonephila clavipes]|nr:transposable element Tcb1 transposase [Trichonephila clavipes]
MLQFNRVSESPNSSKDLRVDQDSATFLLWGVQNQSINRIQGAEHQQIIETIRFPCQCTWRRIVAYRDCGLSFREIGRHVGRNQTTVMQICDRWMHEGTTDRSGHSHPPQCTTSSEGIQIVPMAVTDRSITSRTVAQHNVSVMHHSVSARTIRRRLQQSGLSARRPLLSLPLTQNHRHLHRQWCDERRMWAAEWNEVVFTDESRICL